MFKYNLKFTVLVVFFHHKIIKISYVQNASKVIHLFICVQYTCAFVENTFQ